MWFKNIQVFRWASETAFPSENLEQALEDMPFSPLLSSQLQTSGFSAPLKSLPEQLTQPLAGCIMISVKEQEKLIPNSVIKEALEERIEAIQSKEGRKPTRKEQTNLKDDIIHELTPKAFAKTQQHFAYIDLSEQLLIVNSATAKKAEMVIDNLREVLSSAPFTPIVPKIAPSQTLTHWLSSGRLPEKFTLGDSVVLKSLQEEGAAIRCKQVDLFSEDILAHLSNGFVVSDISLIFDDKIQFTLTDKFVIKQIKLLDVLSDQLEQETFEDEIQAFQQDITLMSMEYRQLIKALVLEMGGESKEAASEKLAQAALA